VALTVLFSAGVEARTTCITVAGPEWDASIPNWGYNLEWKHCSKWIFLWRRLPSSTQTELTVSYTTWLLAAQLQSVPTGVNMYVPRHSLQFVTLSLPGCYLWET